MLEMELSATVLSTVQATRKGFTGMRGTVTQEAFQKLKATLNKSPLYLQRR